MRFSLIFFCLACIAAAQPRAREDEPENPLAGQPEAIEAGRKLFAGSCGACHGQTGEGGRGPNLADGKLIRRQSDEQVFQAIRKGVPGTDMPPSKLSDERTWQLVAFVRSLSAPAYETKMEGDAGAGESLFFGKAGCSGCHMIRGRGGYLGPDLSNAGLKRSLKQLREALFEPSARLSDGFQGVTVTLHSGKRIEGVARNHTNYSLQVLDAKGELHLLRAPDIREAVYHKQSPMPGDYAKKLGAAEQRDVLAFLSRQAVRTDALRDPNLTRRN